MSVRKRPVITVVEARPMSEMGFRGSEVKLNPSNQADSSTNKPTTDIIAAPISNETRDVSVGSGSLPTKQCPGRPAPPRPKLSSSCSDQNMTNTSQQPPAPKPRSINARPNNENPANETRPTSLMRDKNARPVPAQWKSIMSPDEHSGGSGAHATSPPSVLPKPNQRTSCDSSLDVDSVSLDPVPEFGGAWLSDTQANIPPKPAVKTKATIIRPKSMFVKSETLSLAMTNSNTHPDISHAHSEKHSTKPPEFPPKNQELEFPLKNHKSQFSPNNQQPEFPFKNSQSHLPPKKQLQEEFQPKKPEFPSKNQQPEFPSNTQQSEFPLKKREFPPKNQQPEMDLTEISSISKQVASDKSPDTRTNDLKPLMKVKPSVMQKPTVPAKTPDAAKASDFPAKTPDAAKAPDLPAQTPEIAKVADIRKCFDMETYERSSIDSEAFSFQKSFQDDHGKTAPLPKPPRAAPTIIRPGKISQGSSNDLKEEEKCGFADITQGEQKAKPEVQIQRVRPTIIRNKPKLVDQTQNDDCKSIELDQVKISSPDGDMENKDETEVVFKAGNCKPEETLSPVIDGDRGSEDKSHKPAAKPPPPKPSRPPARSSSAMENLNESSSSTSTAPPPRPTSKPGRPPPARPAAVPKRSTSTESSSNNPGLPPTLPGRPQLGHPLYHYVAKGPHAIALYDYASNQADELSFAAGDVVVLVKNINKDWLYGKTAKGEGMFPASFVDVVEAPVSGTNEAAAASVEKNENRRNNSSVSDPSFVSGPRCRARFDYDGEEIGDLAFLAGETIRLLEQIGTEWYRGESAGGKIGMFPASFVEVLEELPAPVESPDSSVFHSQEENVLSPDKISPVKTAEGSSVDMIDGRPHCIALYDFVGEMPDDLSFSCGDKILIHERVGTDWIKGELNGRTGILPAAFVNIVRDVNDLPDEVHEIDNVPRSISTSHESNVESRQVDVQPTSPRTWKALALYEFPGESLEDLAFHAGEEIEVLETISAEWMKGRIGAREGMFPAAFVQKIDH